MMFTSQSSCLTTFSRYITAWKCLCVDCDMIAQEKPSWFKVSSSYTGLGWQHMSFSHFPPWSLLVILSDDKWIHRCAQRGKWVPLPGQKHCHLGKEWESARWTRYWTWYYKKEKRKKEKEEQRVDANGDKLAKLCVITSTWDVLTFTCLQKCQNVRAQRVKTVV